MKGMSLSHTKLLDINKLFSNNIYTSKNKVFGPLLYMYIVYICSHTTGSYLYGDGDGFKVDCKTYNDV